MMTPHLVATFFTDFFLAVGLEDALVVAFFAIIIASYWI